MNKTIPEQMKNLVMICAGAAVFALGFDLFLQPHQFGAGGVSGLALVVNAFLPWLSVGLFSLLLNIPLFLAGYKVVGRRFFWGSLLGMTASSVLLDLFARLPSVETEPLLGAIFGGLLVGAGVGIVFMAGASTGGGDIAARLLKRPFPDISIGKLMLAVDLCIAVITGIVFRDVTKALYCIVALYVSSVAMDAVVYKFDYSCVAVIVSEREAEIRDAIDRQLERGCTFLHGEGAYTGDPKKVIFCAIRRRQVAELQALVMETDPAAFLVLQEAHQVLGEGFDRYSQNAL